jgi:hypothetical protein
MNPKAARLPDFLSHILEAIHRIQRYTRDRSREAFMADEQLQDAIVRNIEIITSRNTPPGGVTPVSGAPAPRRLPCRPFRPTARQRRRRVGRLRRTTDFPIRAR